VKILRAFLFVHKGFGIARLGQQSDLCSPSLFTGEPNEEDCAAVGGPKGWNGAGSAVREQWSSSYGISC
jgi:hypothetical protein